MEINQTHQPHSIPRPMAIDLFYSHASEVSRILLADSGLRSRVASMLCRFQPTFNTIVSRRPASLRAGDIRDIDALIQAVMEKGSPALRSDLERIRQEL